MNYAIAIFLGYFMGSANLAYFLARWKKTDLKKGGSGNLGASNATIILGWKMGILVGLHDIGKSVLAVILARLLFPDSVYIGAVAGVASVLGHIFPFYLKFRGGKGFASFIGMTIALNWKLALAVFALILVVTWITDYIVCGTVSTIIAVPVYLGLASGWILALIVLVATVVILYKHRENYPRILNHTEIGLRSTIRGDHKIRQ